MTRAEQRLADLEARVDELTAQFERVAAAARHAVALHVIGLTPPEPYPAAPPRPCHLRVVREGAS